MLHVCNKLWVRSFQRKEIRLFLPPRARKTQISTFCFFVLPKVSDICTLASHCRLTTWVWPIPFCRAFLFPGCVHKKFCNLVFQRYALGRITVSRPRPGKKHGQTVTWHVLIHPPPLNLVINVYNSQLGP